MTAYVGVGLFAGLLLLIGVQMAAQLKGKILIGLALLLAVGADLFLR